MAICYGQEETELTIQLPIELPKGFEYSVVNKGEFRWWKRFYKPSWFKSQNLFNLKKVRRTILIVTTIIMFTIHQMNIEPQLCFM